MFNPLNPLSIANELLEVVTGRGRQKKSAPDYGDVIYVQRLGYKHFGIYLGNNRVIHYAHDVNGVLCVHETDIESFLDGDTELFACNFPDTYGRPSPIIISNCIASPTFYNLGRWLNSNKKSKYRLYSPEDTVKRAKERLGETEYNLITNNCEHFALWCKTGVHESHQVNDLIEVITGRPIYR